MVFKWGKRVCLFTSNILLVNVLKGMLFWGLLGDVLGTVWWPSIKDIPFRLILHGYQNVLKTLWNLIGPIIGPTHNVILGSYFGPFMVLFLSIRTLYRTNPQCYCWSYFNPLITFLEPYCKPIGTFRWLTIVHCSTRYFSLITWL